MTIVLAKPSKHAGHGHARECLRWPRCEGIRWQPMPLPGRRKQIPQRVLPPVPPVKRWRRPMWPAMLSVLRGMGSKPPKRQVCRANESGNTGACPNICGILSFSFQKNGQLLREYCDIQPTDGTGTKP